MEKRRLIMAMQTRRLPQEYRQIEWLGNSGSQYIITNYIPLADNLAVTMEYMFTASQVGDSMLWGASGGSNVQTFQCECYDNNRWYVGVGIKQFRAVLQDVGNTLNIKYKLYADANILTVDAASATPTQNRSAKGIKPMYIFAWIGTNGSAQYINRGCRIYSLTFKEEGTIAANFVPCVRKLDSKPGMYDTVSNTFYTNEGTGEFIIPA